MESTPARSVARKLLSFASVALSASLVTASLCFGASRDFGTFLSSLLVLPILWILSLIFLVSAVVTDRSSRTVKVSIMLLVLSPIAHFGAGRLRDRVLFVGWSLIHQAELRSSASKDAIIAQWDSWGFAGIENDSYLISDRLDDTSDAASAERWRVRMGLDCSIVSAVRMGKGIYIVTTADCPFQTRRHPNR